MKPTTLPTTEIHASLEIRMDLVTKRSLIMYLCKIEGVTNSKKIWASKVGPTMAHTSWQKGFFFNKFRFLLMHICLLIIHLARTHRNSLLNKLSSLWSRGRICVSQPYFILCFLLHGELKCTHYQLTHPCPLPAN